jgi:hypothetical protein
LLGQHARAHTSHCNPCSHLQRNCSFPGRWAWWTAGIHTVYVSKIRFQPISALPVRGALAQLVAVARAAATLLSCQVRHMMSTVPQPRLVLEITVKELLSRNSKVEYINRACALHVYHISNSHKGTTGKEG